jgi:hypothetical protein
MLWDNWDHQKHVLLDGEHIFIEWYTSLHSMNQIKAKFVEM